MPYLVVAAASALGWQWFTSSSTTPPPAVLYGLAGYGAYQLARKGGFVG